MNPLLPSAGAMLGQIDDPLPLLEGLFSHSPIGVQLYDTAGHTLFVNKAFLEVFGVAPPPEYSVLRDEIAKRVGVDHLIREAFAGKAGTLPVTWYDPGELKHVKVEGAKRSAIETFMVPLLDAQSKVRFVVFFFRDVTPQHALVSEKLAVEKKLEDANRLIESLLSSTKSVIFAKDLEGRYLFVNQQYGRVVGREVADIIGKTQHDIHPDEIAKKMREADLRALEGPLEIEEWVFHPDGSRHDYISQKFPLRNDAGEVYAICGVATDITAVRQLEKELAQAKRMQALGLLAGGVAHDFNNLLGMILLHTESLSQSISADEGALRDLGTIRDAVSRASGLVRQLLAFGGREPMKRQSVDLNQVLSGHSYMIEKLAGGAVPVTLELSARECFAFADTTQVEQILVNLCVNARDALGAAGGRIWLSTGRERIEADSSDLRLPSVPGEYAWFEVSDNGPGMSPAVLERAFDPFFTTKGAGVASGLGLASVFGIVRESGGNLRVRTAPGAGCSVRVLLPLGLPAAPEKAPATPGVAALPAGLALVVEDEPLMREITARILRRNGMDVLEAKDGGEVPALLRANPGVCLLVTDVMMPGQTGPALVKALSAEGLLRGVGVLFVSGYSSGELGQYGFTSGAAQLLEKPFTAEELVSKARTARALAKGQ